MADEDDLLGQSLSDEDLTFLKHADGFREPFEKIKQAKKLIAEARAEIRAIVGGQMADKALTIKKKKTKGKTAKGKKIKFSADGGKELSEDQSAVLAAVQAGKATRPEIDEETGLKPHITKAALQFLRAQGHVRSAGKGRGMQWLGT